MRRAVVNLGLPRSVAAPWVCAVKEIDNLFDHLGVTYATLR